MNIRFKTNKLRKSCEDQANREREYGPVRAKILARRLDDLRAANCLADLATLPQTRCHELIGDRRGQISVDFESPLPSFVHRSE